MFRSEWKRTKKKRTIFSQRVETILDFISRQSVIKPIFFNLTLDRHKFEGQQNLQTFESHIIVDYLWFIALKSGMKINFVEEH